MHFPSEVISLQLYQLSASHTLKFTCQTDHQSIDQSLTNVCALHLTASNTQQQCELLFLPAVSVQNTILKHT